MLELLDATDDVVAVRVSHKIMGSDLDPIMDRLESAMSQHENVHVFV